MSEYDLKSVNLPKLSGLGLRALAGALRNPLSRSVLAKKLLADGGISQLSDLKPEAAPTFLPVRDAGEKTQCDPAKGEGNPDLPKDSPEDSLQDLSWWSTLAQPGSPPTNDARVKKATTLDFARAYRNGETNPVTVANRVLSAIESSQRGDAPLNAMAQWNRDDLLQQATESRRRLEAGQARSVLEGVPIAVKDELDMTPYGTSVGTRFWGGEPAGTDATVVARLRQAGAILIGKANMHEIGINPSGYNSRWGAARNPYNVQHDPGGSSSGSASAVAAGLCPVALGADGGGSIRIPAALCGLAGLKATFGRISEFGAAPLCWSVAHVGPLGLSMADVALAYYAIAGPDPLDAHSLHQPAFSTDPLPLQNVEGLKIGVYREWFQHADQEVVSACEQSLDGLVQSGAKIVDITIPKLDQMRVAHAVSILSEMCTSLLNHREHWEELSPATQASLYLARSFAPEYYIKAQRLRTEALAVFDQAFALADVIATPTTAITAPEIPAGGLKNGWSDLSLTTELMRFAFPSNFTGHPALSVPVGYDGKGLPIGLQLIGKHWQEDFLLGLGFKVEAQTAWRAPTTHFPLL